MIRTFLNHRQTEREARLCYQQPPGASNSLSPAPNADPRSTFDRVFDEARDVAKWLIDKAANFGGDALEALGKFAADIPDAILTGLEKAWETLPSQQEVIDYFSRMAFFFRELPWISSYFPSAEHLQDIATIQNLTDHAQWIAAFREHPDLLDDPNTEELPDGVFGPVELLKHLKPEERQTIYVQYVDAFIPPEVQEQHHGESFMRKSMSERYTAMKPKMPVLNAALGGILGIDKYDTALQEDADKKEADSLTRDSLETYYAPHEGMHPDITFTEGLTKDYAQTLELQRRLGIPVIATDPDDLIRNIGPSRFRGALLSGVVDRAKLDELGRGFAELEHAKRLATGDAARELDFLRQENNERVRKEAESFMDTFNNMDTFPKLLLIAAAIYGFIQSKTVRVLTGGAVAAYFFQKLVLKHDDPIEKWSHLVGGVTGKLTGANAEIVGGKLTPGYVEQSAEHADVIVNFLDDYNQQEIARQTIGFGVLLDLPLSSLARHYEMRGEDGSEMMLNLSDRTLNGEIANALEQRGWSKTRYKEFFESRRNRDAVSEAMSFVFFRMAAMAPENKPRVELVLEALRKCEPGTSLGIFGSPDYQNVLGGDTSTRLLFQRAHEEYVRLVAEGRERATRSSQSLGDFLLEQSDVSFVPVDISEAGNVHSTTPAPAPSNVPSGPTSSNAPPPASQQAPAPATNVAPAPSQAVAPPPAPNQAPAPASQQAPAPVKNIAPSPSQAVAPPPASNNAPLSANQQAPAPATNTAPAPSQTTPPEPQDAS